MKYETFCGKTTNEAIEFIVKYNDSIINANKDINNNIIKDDNNNIINDNTSKNEVEKHEKLVINIFNNIINDERWGKEYINSNQKNGARLTGEKIPKRLDGNWILDKAKPNEYIKKKHIEKKNLFSDEINKKNIKSYFNTVKTLLLNLENFKKIEKYCGNPFIKEDDEKNGLKLELINKYIHNSGNGKKEEFFTSSKGNRLSNPLKRFWAIINNMN